MITVIVPAYNEGDGIRTLHERLTACAADWEEPYEILLIDDGSRDNTLEIAEELAAADRHLKIISLSRNFGHQPAVTAGLEHARGDVVAIIDADLQDPPEELHRFFAKCREGYDVIYGVRTKRKEGPLKRAGYFVFYRVLSQLASIEIPLDSGDFCVMNRRAVDAINSLPERGRFVRGLRSWVGFRQFGLMYERHARLAGEPKYTFAKLVNLALDGIINFSSKPLRLIALIGLGLGAASILVALFVLTQYVADWTIWGYNPRESKGWTSTILTILFLASVQFFCLGIIGEYLGRMFEEIKQRPTYMVGKTVNLDKPMLRAGDAEELGEQFSDEAEIPVKG
jgi:dolichol-phosphate mannosyltransferase